MSLHLKKNPTVYIEEGAMIPFFRYQIYYIEQKIETLQKLPIEQQNVGNHKQNDTYRAIQLLKFLYTKFSTRELVILLDAKKIYARVEN